MAAHYPPTVVLHHVSLGGRAVEIESRTASGGRISAAIFGDIPPAPEVPAHIRFIVAKQDEDFALTANGTTIYKGNSVGDLAGFLVGEVVYHLCDLADEGLMLHAACLARDNITVAMPATSGSGKTTLSGFLITRGFSYLTDELIHIPLGTHQVEALTRPLNFKRPAFSVVKSELGVDCEAADSLAGSWASLVPHRKLNSVFDTRPRPLTHLVYPRYSRDDQASLENISTAKSAMYLMGCLLNARNLTGHGFEECTRLARGVAAATVCYRSFAEAEALLLPWLDSTTAATPSDHAPGPQP